MVESTVRLVAFDFGGVIIVAMVVLCLYLASSEGFGSNLSIIAILLGGLITGARFIMFGIKGEHLN